MSDFVGNYAGPGRALFEALDERVARLEARTLGPAELREAALAVFTNNVVLAAKLRAEAERVEAVP